ncbi:aldehyde dehydrogenase family protein [Halococcus thailandensis]|uniref:NAD-dependent aldehyde dehydrogenase n=1 Tax=Halococcus thailandensis JCM 13552 TaxID=1227457 RepID=M0NG54_9EURY|nr:aldehyde dehydrogenase family protein [Halococcus thailandensis]EMA56508.1 NAD-dependent aldehyde dehydrogenase [Halococcus thailandensis JCM 13552]
MQEGHADRVSEEIVDKHRNTAEDVLTDDEYGHLIDGEWIDSGSKETMMATDATTGADLARFQRGTPDDVDRAVASAREAFEGSWSQKSPRQRSDLLLEVADELESEKLRIARIDSLEMGKANQHSAFVDATIMVEQFRFFASLARTESEGRLPPMGSNKLAYTKSEPHGVIGQISAWNFPAMFVGWKMAPALAAGNTVVFKPSSRATLSTLEIVNIVDEVLPSGAVNVVTGTGSEVGDAITAHQGIDKLSLTGSTGAGEHVMKNAAETITPVSLELGGKSPNIIYPDADLEKAVEGAVISIWFNQGEQCTAGSRLFLHEDIAEEFLELFEERTAGLTVGDPLEGKTDMGPLVDADHLDEVLSYVETAKAEGATIRYGGGTPDDPALDGAPFVEPTIIEDVENDHTVACEEVFGPVLSVLEWNNEEEMLAAANDTQYGLASAVWTEDLETAHSVADELEAGTVWINTYNDLFEPVPHGGYKQSGLGRELAEETYDEYTQTKSVMMNFGNLPRMG